MRSLFQLFLSLSLVFNFTFAQAQGFSPIAQSKFSRSVSKTTTYTATVSDETIYVDGSGGAWSLNLPTAVGIKGKRYKIVRTDNTIANAVTLDPNSTQTINGSTTWPLYTQYELIEIESNNSNWIIVGRSTSNGQIAYTPTGTNLGTLANVSVYYERVGSGIIMHGYFTVGTTVAASPPCFSIPAALDTAKLAGDQKDNLGIVIVANPTLQNLPDNTKGPFILTYDAGTGASSLCIGDDVDSDLGVFGFNNASTMLSSSNPITFHTSLLPIANWMP